MNRGLEHFTDGLSAVFHKMAFALKPGAPLAFTYHNNKLGAYFPVAAALLDAGFECTASLPCPAEMGSSIHPKGTGSSIIDTVFVCRKVPTSSGIPDLISLRESFQDDQSALRRAGVKLTAGDLRCIVYGQLTRYAVQHLGRDWDRTESTSLRLDRVRDLIEPLKTTLPYEIHRVDKDAHTSGVLPVVAAI